ncbi:MAG: hypothetical protein JXB38_15060 [Anaerolineales bacterium]|nr:hypothetical protein [Anaerolineales bacterium]
MTTSDRFDVLLLIARPAAGKSEIIDYLKRTPVEERKSRFHVGEFEEIDDFPILWGWFEEDRILAKMGYPRLHSDDQEYFLNQYQWDVLIRLICLEYAKKLRDNPHYHEQYTTVVEFSRGAEHGGYRSAFQHLSAEMLERMAILYVNVSWGESQRKDAARFNPDRPDSVLEHGMTSKKLERLYKEIDWEEVSAENPEYINIQGVKVPYVVFENEDDVTTGRGDALGNRLEAALQHLWTLSEK